MATSLTGFLSPNYDYTLGLPTGNAPYNPGPQGFLSSLATVNQTPQNPWGSIGHPDSQLKKWLAKRGLSRSESDDGGYRYFRSDGEEGQRRIFGGAIPELPKFNAVDIGGTNFTRLGADPNAPDNPYAGWRAYDTLRGGATYDPTYGWVAPSDLYNSAAGQSYTGGDRGFFDYLHTAATGGLGAVEGFGLQESLANAPVVGAAALTAGGLAGAAGYGPMAAGAGAGAEAGAGAGTAAGYGATPGTLAELNAAAALEGTGAVSGGVVPSAAGAAPIAGVSAPGIVDAGAYSGPEFQGAVPPQSTGTGATFDAFGNPINSGGGYFPPGSAGAGAGAGANTAAAGTALSRIIDGTATTADWVSVLGTAGATGLGMFSSNQQANTLERLAAENRADRLPYLQASQGYLADPESYWQGPGQASLDANLRRLSASHGNPISSPTALGIASQAGLMDWRDAITGFGNMGLSGADTRANLGVGAAGAQANMWGNLAGGVSDLINPRKSLADLMREYAITVGGSRI